MKKFLFLIVVLALFGCGMKKPAVHEPITAKYPNRQTKELRTALTNILTEYNISINQKKSNRTYLVTDSFDVKNEYCDCGTNMVGNEYPGSRRGVMKISLKQKNGVNIKFDFRTKLLIQVNNKIVICNSYGILEKEILTKLEEQYQGISIN